MLKKRLIGVVTIKDGWAVQSFGYRRYLPLGKPQCVVENLDRWGADEILVQVIDRSVGERGPDFDLLERIGKLGLVTPLIYGGGIRSVADGVQLVQMGADRLLLDTLLHQDTAAVEALSKRLGAQALIASLPLTWRAGALAWHDYRNRCDRPLKVEFIQFLRTGALSEAMLVDCENEGRADGFTNAIAESFPIPDMPLIAFGGLSKPAQMKYLLQRNNIVAVAVGNFLNYREHAVQEYKAALKGLPVRLPTYTAEHTLMAGTDA